MVMGAEAQLDPGAANGGDVGGIEVLLPQMHPVAAKVDGDLPVIVDHKKRASLPTQALRLRNLLFQRLAGQVLDPELHQPHTEWQQTPEPCDVIEYRVETRQGHQVNALPSTGVEGAAISRGSIGSASNPIRPASRARVKPSAIAAGSPALATAVLSSTAS